MAIKTAGYQKWDEARRAPAWGVWAIVRTGLTIVLRRRVFWILIGLGLLNFLFNFAFIYLKATLTIQNGMIGNFLDNYQVTGTGSAFAEFMFAQASITALLLAFSGSVLIGGDYRQGGVVYYLSRRIDRRHYVMGKLLTVGAIVSFITTLPALALYLEYGVLTSSFDYFLDHPRILTGILGYGLVLAVVQSLLLFAIAAWVPRTVPLVMSWLGVFVLFPLLAEALRAIQDNRTWLLLNLWGDMQRLGSWCFGTLNENKAPGALTCASILTVLCGLCLFLILSRVRAVEVVQ
ncbi:MAG: ABC transporter permease [Planctomycetes bacterium]|nr:ABC transporter permease [Planctomycetota bacterium]